MEAKLTINRRARSELYWKKQTCPGRVCWNEEFLTKIDCWSCTKGRNGGGVKGGQSELAFPALRNSAMGASEEDLENFTKNPIEEPEFDDCFVMVISHLKENHKKHQLRKRAFDLLPLIPSTALDHGKARAISRSRWGDR